MTAICDFFGATTEEQIEQARLKSDDYRKRMMYGEPRAERGRPLPPKRKTLADIQSAYGKTREQN